MIIICHFFISSVHGTEMRVINILLKCVFGLNLGNYMLVILLLCLITSPPKKNISAAT